MARKRDWSITQARARLLDVIDRAVLEGPQEIWRNGKKARWIQDMDWEALLPRSLADVRRECSIADPAAYRAVIS